MYLLRRPLIILGLFIIVIGVGLGGIYQDSGCGVCGGYEQIFPKPVLALWYIPTAAKPSPEACMLMGCSPGTIFPIFLDIFTLGGLLGILGAVKKKAV